VAALELKTASRQDIITEEIFANLFKAVLDEMAWIILRSSHTTFVKETQDFAASLVTKEGEATSEQPVNEWRCTR
jgi:N-methylhydantoinase B/oxoprolinase/acetone carboxylase alpha subunit